MVKPFRSLRSLHRHRPQEKIKLAKKAQDKKLKVPSSTFFNKKGQMKIQQTAFMLLAITLFFVLVGMVVLIFRFTGLRESATLLEEKNARLLVSKLADSPEFSCGGAFGIRRTSCVDEDKILALKKNVGSYSNFWGVSSISVVKLYPEFEEINILTSENVGLTESNFVSICKKELSEGNFIYDKCEIAELIVGYESKSD